MRSVPAEEAELNSLWRQVPRAFFIYHLTSKLFCRSLSETYTQGAGEEKEWEKRSPDKLQD